MRSFRIPKDDRRRIYLSLVDSVEGRLRELFAKRHEETGLTQAALADKLDVDRSVITRRLKGAENMTLKTVADLVWAMGGCVEVEIFCPLEKPGRNDLVRVADPLQAQVPRVIKGDWEFSGEPKITVRSDLRMVG